MSAILSADDLNDFISPGVACIKPIEPLPDAAVSEASNPYEVTTEDKLEAANPVPASISLTDCLACSGCVTSAEAVLVSLQSHAEVLNTLETYPSASVAELESATRTGHKIGGSDSKIFVASVSPQIRASLAAAFDITEPEAGYLVEQFLSGPQGLQKGGRHGSHFAYVVDTNRMRAASLQLGAEEVAESQTDTERPSRLPRPILASACPGWVCFAEKTHPHLLPHLSKVKSPQALTGTLLKSVLSKALNVPPSQIWHLAIMPCFDKKLEASREELTNKWWAGHDASSAPVRDVDCVITPRELLTLANDRGINLLSLPHRPLSKQDHTPFPHPLIARHLFPKLRRRHGCALLNDQTTPDPSADPAMWAGTSGGYLQHILRTQQHRYPGSTIHIQRGRNSDVVEYSLLDAQQQSTLLKCGRFYGFRNIQNLVRKLKPPKAAGRLPEALQAAQRRKQAAAAKDAGISEFAYVEVMACPGGCTNGGGQIRVEEAMGLQQEARPRTPSSDRLSQDATNNITQRDWLRRVNSAYFSSSASSFSSASASPRSSTPSRLSETAISDQPDSMSEVELASHSDSGCDCSIDPDSAPNAIPSNMFRKQTQIQDLELTDASSPRAINDHHQQQNNNHININTANRPVQSPVQSPVQNSDPRQDQDEDRDRELDDPNSISTRMTISSSPSSFSSLTIRTLLSTWSSFTAIPLEKLAYTEFHRVDSDVGSNNTNNNNNNNNNNTTVGGRRRKGGDEVYDDRSAERIARLAGSIGGGW